MPGGFVKIMPTVNKLSFVIECLKWSQQKLTAWVCASSVCQRIFCTWSLLQKFNMQTAGVQRKKKSLTWRQPQLLLLNWMLSNRHEIVSYIRIIFIIIYVFKYTTAELYFSKSLPVLNSSFSSQFCFLLKCKSSLLSHRNNISHVWTDHGTLTYCDILSLSPGYLMAGEINTKHKILNKNLICQFMLDSNGNSLFANYYRANIFYSCHIYFIHCTKYHLFNHHIANQSSASILFCSETYSCALMSHPDQNCIARWSGRWQSC